MEEKKKLGEMLIEKGMIDKMQLEAAFGRQKQWGGRLGFNLVKLNFISEIVLMKFLCNQLKLPGTDLARTKFKEEILSLISCEIAQKHNIIPLEIREAKGKRQLFVAMSDPYDFSARDELRFLTGIPIKPVIATESQILSAIKKHYEGKRVIKIEPLSEKIDEIKNGKIVHEVLLKEKVELNLKIKNNSLKKNPEVLALVNILIKKGVFAWDEYMEELFKETEQL